MPAPSVNVSVFDDWRGILSNQGVQTDRLITFLGSGRKQRGQGDQAMVDLATFVDLLEQATLRSSQNNLSWSAGLSANYARRGKVGRAVLGAKTLGTGLRRLSTYIPLIQDATCLKFEVDADWVMLSYKILDPDIWPRHEDAMYSLGLYSGLIKSAAADVWSQVEISVETEQRMVRADLCNVVHTNVVYGQPSNSIRFPASALDAPLALLPPVENTLLNELSECLTRKKRVTPVSERARERILSEISDGCISQEYVAKELGMSSRTLRRKLASEELSYQSLLDDCRMRFAALEFRACRSVSISEMALKLGYSEHSTFTRAFSRWSGMAPKEYRKSFMVH